MSIAEDATVCASAKQEEEASRLPTSVYPTHYDLIIKSDLKELVFEGQGLIQLEVKEATRHVIFNLGPTVALSRLELKNSLGQVQAYEVPASIDEPRPNVKSTELATDIAAVEDLSAVLPGEVLVDKTQERIALGLPGSWKLEAGDKMTLQATWNAPLTNSMMGYYKSTWKKAGLDEHYASTQFQVSGARRAYPSWDEPAVKTTYTIAMVSRKGSTNLSNMPVVEEKPWTGSIELGNGRLGDDLSKVDEEEWNVTKFAKTPLMSSYLVAWANGEFSHLESQYTSPLSGRVVPLRTYTTPDLIHQAQFVLDVKAKILPVYEEIFEIEYPLPKLDTLAVAEFHSGAMENWGLIISRTSEILWDPKKSSLSDKKWIIRMISHECAHMWFGNIVTPEWWTYLWLNEAFASLMGEVIIPDRVYPEYNSRQAFLTFHLRNALNLDELRSSHPIEVDCPDAHAADQIFDNISYSKGAAVLRMLSSVVGEDRFLKGVSIYLKKHLYGNSVTADLWEGIKEASGVDVSKIMREWVVEVGFPVITVEESKGSSEIKVRQNRFLATGDLKPEEDQILWYVPLELKKVARDGGVSVDHHAILQEREATFKVGDSRAFKINAETVGVYRVAYTPERLSALGEEAAKTDSGFTTEDRIGLVSDAMTLAAAGHGKTSGALNLISKLSGEQEFQVWGMIAMSLRELNGAWWEQPEKIRDALDKLRVQLFRPVVERLGWEFKANEDYATAQLRALAIGNLADAKDTSTISEIQRRFQPFLVHGDDSQIAADLQLTIFTIAVRHGGEAEYNKIREVYDDPPNPVAKVDAIYALAAATDKLLIKKTLHMIEDGSVAEQDVGYVFYASVANRFAFREVLQYFKDNYDALLKRFGDKSEISGIVRRVFSGLTTKEDLKATEAFFKDRKTDKYNLALLQAMDSIQASIKWLKRDTADVEKWLKDNEYLR